MSYLGNWVDADATYQKKKRKKEMHQEKSCWEKMSSVLSGAKTSKQQYFQTSGYLSLRLTKDIWAI